MKSIPVLCLMLINLSAIDPVSASSTDHSKPPFLSKTIIQHYYDGVEDDLLTAGWSNQQLALRKMPAQKERLDHQLIRKAAYYNNIIALLDTTPRGGFGRLFGPKPNHQPVTGFEYLAYSVDSDDQIAASFALQIPDDMKLKNSCLIVAASSGSRGVYGAVGTVGFWALAHHCAIVYTDKGTGTGFYFFDEKKGFTVEGLYKKESTASQLLFSPSINKTKQDFLATHPTAVAVKHAYSKTNVEQNFGLYVMQAAQFAMYQLNQHFRVKNKSFNKDNTLVIAASISNGGVSSVKVAEIDRQNLFDGIVASEPNIYPQPAPQLQIIQGTKSVPLHSLPGYDYFIALNLYTPCALLTNQALSMPFAQPKTNHSDPRENWCKQLSRDGFIQGKTTQELANDSLSKLTSLGIMENKQTLMPLMKIINIWPALALTYTNQFGRFDLSDNICSQYFSATNMLGQATKVTNQARQIMFATSNGIPPTAGIKLASSDTAITPYQRALCFYKLSKTQRVRKGVNQVVSNGFYNNKPMILIHGRSDNLVAPNHTSRPYYAQLMRTAESLNNHSPIAEPNVRYYEVTNAQHFDAFTALPQYAGQYVPLHYYFDQSLDLMLKQLTENQPLPASQVIHTTPRKTIDGKLAPLQMSNLPQIEKHPRNPIKWLIGKQKEEKLIIPD